MPILCLFLKKSLDVKAVQQQHLMLYEFPYNGVNSFQSLRRFALKIVKEG